MIVLISFWFKDNNISPLRCSSILHNPIYQYNISVLQNRIHGIANYTDTLSKIPYRYKCQQTDYCNLKDPFENACNDVTVRFERKLLLSELFSSVPSASIFFAFKIFSPQMSSFKKRPSLSFHKIPLYQKKDNYKYVLVLFKPVSYFTNSLTFALLPTRSLK